MNKPTEYVCGFLFNMDRTRVALIRKNRPNWQAGFLNGIGGHIENDEPPIFAMTREFFEETGYKTRVYDWHKLITLTEARKTWSVNFFYCISNSDDLSELKTMTDEEVVIIDVKNLNNEKVIDNLKWLIPMCLDKSQVHGELISN